MVAPIALHRNPEVWDDPDSFKPDRFLSQTNTARNPFAYVPFSAGPRNCIGKLKLGLSFLNNGGNNEKPKHARTIHYIVATV